MDRYELDGHGTTTLAESTYEEAGESAEATAVPVQQWSGPVESPFRPVSEIVQLADSGELAPAEGEEVAYEESPLSEGNEAYEGMEFENEQLDSQLEGLDEADRTAEFEEPGEATEYGEASPGEAPLQMLDEMLQLEPSAASSVVDRVRGVAAFAVGPTLRRGSTGVAVAALQRALVTLGQDIAVDGQFGPNTERAVRTFQTSAGIGVDGIVGPQTKKAISAALAGKTGLPATPPTVLPPTVQPGTWRVARSLERLRAEVNAVAAKRSKAYDGTIGDSAHQARASDHNPNASGVVCALDLTHDPAGGFDAHAYAERIRQRWHPALKYIISDRRIASVKSGRAWRQYTGSNPHNKHIHVSVGVGLDGQSTGAYDDASPWGIAEVIPTAPPPPGVNPPLPVRPTTVDQRASYVIELLRNRYDFSLNAAAGIVGNLIAESGILPDRIEGSSTDTPMRARNFAGQVVDFTPEDVMNRSATARRGPQKAGIGLAQWTSASRRAGLFRYVYRGRPLGPAILSNVDAQVDYLANELQTSYAGVNRVLRSPGITLNDATDEVVYSFEIPGSIIVPATPRPVKLPRSDPRVQEVFRRRRQYAARALQAYRAAHQ